MLDTEYRYVVQSIIEGECPLVRDTDGAGYLVVGFTSAFELILSSSYAIYDPSSYKVVPYQELDLNYVCESVIAICEDKLSLQRPSRMYATDWAMRLAAYRGFPEFMTYNKGGRETEITSIRVVVSAFEEYTTRVLVFTPEDGEWDSFSENSAGALLRINFKKP